MERSKIRLIAAKELLDTLRDRRTLFVSLVMPLLLYPALLFGLTMVLGATRRNLEAEQQRVLVDGLRPDNLLFRMLAEQGLQPEELDGAGVQGGIEHALGERAAGAGGDAWRLALQRELAKGSYAALLVLRGKGEGFSASMGSHLRSEAHLYFDPTDEASKVAQAKAAQALSGYVLHEREELIARRPGEKSLLRFVAEPVTIQPVELASKSRKGAYSFAPLLGVLVVLMSLTGAFYPAVDLAAGEKERGTMETLLVAPVARRDIVLGKFLAIWVVAVVTALLNLAVMGVTFSKVAGMALSGKLAFSLPPATLLAFAAILIPTAALFGATALAISAFATSYKEGQQYLTPLFLVAMPLAMLSMLPGFTISYGLAVVPVANVVLLVKAMLLGGDVAGQAFVAVICTAIYAAIALRAAVAVFQREDVLFRAGAGKGFDPTSLRAARLRLPSPALAALLFFTVLALMFFLSGGVPTSLGGVVRAFLLAQLAAVLAPTLLFAWRAKLDRKRTFSLRVPAVPDALAGILAGASAAVVLSWLQATLLPHKEPGGFEEITRSLAHASPWLGFALIAILPPICEELLCRGVLLSAFRWRYGALKAVLLSAVCFSILHLSPVRMPVTLTAGLALGYFCHRTGSIGTSMLFHAAYNGLLASALYLAATQDFLSRLDPVRVAVAAAVFVACILLVETRARRRATLTTGERDVDSQSPTRP